MSSPQTPGTAPTLADLARHAGIQVDWTDARGRPQRVADDVLVTILDALGLPASDARQIADSVARLQHEDDDAGESFVIADVGAPIDIAGTDADLFELIAENGERRSIHAHGLARHAGHARLPAIDEPGYYVLEADGRRWTIAVAPTRCPGVADVLETANPRAWALAVQLYALRRRRDGQPAQAAGAGDFTALAQLASAAGQRGATALAISPVHAAFSADPARYSPYAPSSRLFLNALYIDPAAQLGPQAAQAALTALGLNEEALRLDALPLIEWPAVARLRLKLLRRMYDDLRGNTSHPQRDAFDAFRRAGGEALESHARFEALHARFLPPLGDATDWRHWPADLRDPTGAGVQAYAHAHDKEITFHVFLQWLADAGLAAAQRSALANGMGIGLIGDLAVGTDPGGSHAWSRQEDFLEGLSPGAPPDIYNPGGQRWGLTAFSPRALRRKGYAAFIEMLRASLAHAGGIRIDHVLGLARMWLVPQDAPATQGAYLRYPLEDMLRLIALEAWRHRAIVVGENLGTVPEGFNERIERAGMLGMDVLWFQRDDAGTGTGPAPFLPPERWPATAIATTTTHDLPTVAGWWRGDDIGWRARLNLLGPDETEAGERARRQQDRDALLQALRAAGCLPADAEIPTQAGSLAATPEGAPAASVVEHTAASAQTISAVNAAARAAADSATESAADPAADSATDSAAPAATSAIPATPAADLAADPASIGAASPIADSDIDTLLPAVLRFVAMAPTPLLVVPMEDLLGLPEQPNLPGTVDTHPNWRRRLPVEVQSLFDLPAVRQRLTTITDLRRTQ